MRLIDADAFLKELKKFLIGIHDTYLAMKVLRIVKQVISKQPTIEAKPVVHAHWEEWGCEGTVCSKCYGRVLYECDEHEEKSKFCPHCGAKMDEKEGG